MALTEMFTSILSGGVTGVVGAVVSRIADYYTKKQDNAHQIQMKELEIQSRSMDAKIMELEWESRENIAALESETKIEVADAQSFQAALSSEPKIYANSSKLTRVQNSFMVALDFIRGIIRPGLTVYLCVLTTILYFKVSQPLDPKESAEMQFEIIRNVLYLTSCVVLFWFGSRAKDQKK